jgi:TonB family protein
VSLWLSNLAAYSVQLGALVATAAVVVAMLRLHVPRPALRFWQIVFASSVMWPAYQLWANTDAAFASAGGVMWSAASAGVAEMRAGIAALETGVTTLIIAVLAIGAVVRLGWIGLGLIRLRSIRRAAAPAPALSSIAEPLQSELGVTAEIRFSDMIDSPATIGARRPMVLLPSRVRDLPLPVQRAVLCHELIHVRRRDWLPVLLEELWCAVLWFHPAARVLASRLVLARETLVDEATIAHTRDRRAYAAALLEFSTARPRLAGATALIGRRHLERRIALLAKEVSMSRFSLAVRLAVAAGAVAIATIATTSTMPIGATVQAQAEKVYKPADDASITLPSVLREVRPYYTPGAMEAKIQGVVWMAVVVLASGDVGDVVVSRSLDKEHGLDDEAVKAVRQWKFTPGTKDGKAVPVEVTIQMAFTLK